MEQTGSREQMRKKKKGRNPELSSHGLVVNIMKSLCQPASRTIYLPDWRSRHHAGAKVILQQHTVLLCVCVYVGFCVKVKAARCLCACLQVEVGSMHESACVRAHVHDSCSLHSSFFIFGPGLSETSCPRSSSSWLRHAAILPATCQPIS